LPLSMEASIGHFLPHMRGLLFGLIAMLAIRWAVRAFARSTSHQVGAPKVRPACGPLPPIDAR
jgi:hypothetical protein